jgi:hypothetical protein
MKKSIFRSRLLKIAELQNSLSYLKALNWQSETRHLENSPFILKLIEDYSVILNMKTDSVYNLTPRIIDSVLAEYELLILLHVR